EFLSLVEENPGITVSEAVPRMPGINENYAYRIAKELVNQGTVRKVGKKYFRVSLPFPIVRPSGLTTGSSCKATEEILLWPSGGLVSGPCSSTSRDNRG